MGRPLIGLTCDVEEGQLRLRPRYAEMVAAAGGVPVLLPCLVQCLPEYLDRCAGFVLTGGDDPIMEDWGLPTHPRARPVDAGRQAFERALLRQLDGQPDRPVLGICLGMQMMALEHGAVLDQHLPDTLPTADRHWGRVDHEIGGDLGAGTVLSHHRQAITDAGRLRVVATAPDGVIEAVRSESRPFYLGVQWHPERTDDERLGLDLFRELVSRC